MKRRIRSLLTVLLASSLLAGPALADRKDRGDRGDHGGGWERRERPYDGRRDYRDAREYRGRGNGGRGGDRDQREWRQERYDPRSRYRGDEGPPAYAYPPAYSRSAPPPAYNLRRGGSVPPSYRGAIVPDYSRHRLRPPPPGFAWVRAGDRYLLVSRSTGQIFDVIGD
jgi:Ni/Co efflux regulator RcnB